VVPPRGVKGDGGEAGQNVNLLRLWKHSEPAVGPPSSAGQMTLEVGLCRGLYTRAEGRRPPRHYLCRGGSVRASGCKAPHPLEGGGGFHPEQTRVSPQRSPLTDPHLPDPEVWAASQGQSDAFEHWETEPPRHDVCRGGSVAWLRGGRGPRRPASLCERVRWPGLPCRRTG
jgi:hypothetical protein